MFIKQVFYEHYFGAVNAVESKGFCLWFTETFYEHQRALDQIFSTPHHAAHARKNAGPGFQPWGA
jgi:hypothetical protein